MCQMPRKCSVHFMLCEFHKFNLDKRSREGTEWSLKMSLSEGLLLSRLRTGKVHTFVRIVCKVKYIYVYICMTSISTFQKTAVLYVMLLYNILDVRML